MISIRTFGCLAALALPMAVPAGAASAPPPNDNFDQAQEIPGLPAEATGSNVDATREPDEPNHANQGGQRSIWFKWTAPRDVGVSIGGCATPPDYSRGQPAYLAVYVQTARFGLVEQRQSGFRALAGQVFYIAAASRREQDTDPAVCFRLLPGPPNDDFAAATTLEGFPTSGVQGRSSDHGAATREPGEPAHEGSSPTSSPPSAEESVWFSWKAPADGPVRVRQCGASGVLGVYTGDRVDALTRVATRHSSGSGASGRGGCGSMVGGSVLIDASAGQVYRIAVTTSGSFQLFVENQVTVASVGRQPFFLYTAFPGQADDVKLRLVGAGADRALLLQASGMTAANGCHADASSGGLRCPVPGKAAVGVDIDLRDGNDRADVRLPGRGRSSGEGEPYRRVDGGEGDDTLTGSAGFYSLNAGWRREVTLLGGPGADRLRGAWGYDRLQGGPGRDRIDGGAGSDRLDGGRGDDRLVGIDKASDTLRCGAGRDRARLDGFDLPTGCERRDLGSPARAVAVGAAIDDGGDGSDEDHLAIAIACPIDAKPVCRARVTAPVGGGRTSNRRIRLEPGRSGWATDYSVSYGAMNRLVGRSIRVTVTTRGRSGAKLKFARRLPVSDTRYHGE
jgi:hypothetical protein